MGKAARKKKAAERAAKSAELAEDSLLDEWTPRWVVALGGHRWVDSEGGRQLKIDLTSSAFTPPGAKARPYNPVQVPGLFLDFARLDPTEDRFRAFADERGLLGAEGGRFGEGKSPIFEWWEDWLRAHQQVSVHVRLWEAIRKAEGGDRTALSNCCSCRGPTADGFTAWRLHPPGEPKECIAGRLLTETEPVAAAKRFVQEAINDGLRDGAGVRILWHPDRERYVLRVLPRTLLGCIWWQFARAFTGEVVFAECRVCRRPLERGPGAFMSTREFCSPACKQKDHRQRVRRANELKAGEMSVKQIAKELGTEPAVINRWLTKRK